jgi:hypothetical protein
MRSTVKWAGWPSASSSTTRRFRSEIAFRKGSHFCLLLCDCDLGHIAIAKQPKYLEQQMIRKLVRWKRAATSARATAARNAATPLLYPRHASFGLNGDFERTKWSIPSARRGSALVGVLRSSQAILVLETIRSKWQPDCT